MPDLIFNNALLILARIFLILAFLKINNLDGRGTLRSLKEEVESKNKKSEFKKYLSTFKIRPVLTAHPTQFYPGSVLGIITDLTE